ncbi:MAG: flavin reductase, partial [Oscillospiraceae bacterium]|nr:flavin reductase [Oscillospiraceae bacterium]
LENNDYFTVSLFPEEYRRDLSILGSKSGRDGDKVALTALTPISVEHGVDFEQAELTFVCRKLYSHQFEKELVPQEVRDWIYDRGFPPHTMFIGEVVDVMER